MIANGKATVVEGIGEIQISIPSKKNWFALLFGTAWLGGWYFGLKSVGNMFSHDITNSEASGFIIFWTIGWTIGGLAIIFLLLWGYFGKEQFDYKNGNVRFSKTVFGLGVTRNLKATEIENIHSQDGSDGWSEGNRWAFWGLGKGKIVFDYGLKTFSFGLAVDDAEATFLVNKMVDVMSADQAYESKWRNGIEV